MLHHTCFTCIVSSAWNNNICILLCLQKNILYNQTYELTSSFITYDKKLSYHLERGVSCAHFVAQLLSIEALTEMSTMSKTYI